MSQLEEQARRIIGSLDVKPGLLFEILRIVEDEYRIVGPWVPLENKKGGFYYERCTPNGESMAMTAPVPNVPNKWQWQVKGGKSGDTFTRAGGAQQLADGELRHLGWMLA